MYLRLQDAREQRLRVLTKNIRSAHANKPKGDGRGDPSRAGQAGETWSPGLLLTAGP